MITVARRVKEAAEAGEILLGPKLRRSSARPSRPTAHAWSGSSRARRPLPLWPDTPFVGRQAELEQLQLAARAAFSARSCRHLVIVGEPGVGKSRLATEPRGVACRRCARTDRPLRALRGGATYQPLRDVLADAFGDKDLFGSIRKALKGDENAGASRSSSNGRSRLRRRPRRAATRSGPSGACSRRFAGKKPLLVVLEDLHWAEPTFLDLVEYVAGWSEGARWCCSRSPA